MIRKIIVILAVMLSIMAYGKTDDRIDAMKKLPKGIHVTDRNCEVCCGSGHKWVNNDELVDGASVRKVHVNFNTMNFRIRDKTYSRRKVHTKDMGRVKISCEKCLGTGKRLVSDDGKTGNQSKKTSKNGK